LILKPAINILKFTNNLQHYYNTYNVIQNRKFGKKKTDAQTQQLMFLLLSFIIDLIDEILKINRLLEEHLLIK